MNRIKELRQNMKINQEDLAKLLNVQRSVVSKYENGSVPLTDETLKKLSDYFEVSTDYILCLSDTPTPLVIPAELKDVYVAFDKGGERKPTQNQIDRIAEFARFIMSEDEGE